MSFLKRVLFVLSLLSVFSGGARSLLVNVAKAASPETKSGEGSGGTHGGGA